VGVKVKTMPCAASSRPTYRAENARYMGHGCLFFNWGKGQNQYVGHPPTTALATCYDGATCTPTRVGVTTTVNPHGAFTATFDSPSSAITKPVSYICVGRN